MRILVTGANGLLGHHVVMQLQKANHEVNIIVRDSRVIFFNTDKINIFTGNFDNYESLRHAAENCEAIIHIAAVTATYLLKYNDYSRINVDGCHTIIKVANELNINNIVFVSTSNTVGYGTSDKPADENTAMEFPFTESFYAQSKSAAEKLFVEASKIPHRHVIIINPAFMIGSYDTKPSSGKLMLMGYKKWILAIPNGGKNFVAATDVATAICNALTMGKNGERYLTTGINLSFREFYKLQSKIGQYHQQIIVIPDWLLRVIGKAGDFLRSAGIKTEVSSRNIEQLLITESYQSTKAEKELKMPHTPLEEAVYEALNWFKSVGKINSNAIRW